MTRLANADAVRIPLKLSMAVALILMLGSTGNAGRQLADFGHDGTTYVVSEEYREGDWFSSQTFCKSLGSGWRLPTFDETMAMRGNYDGSDPWDISGQPSWCMPGMRALWTSTECDHGAIFVQAARQQIVCDYVPIMTCYWPDAYCCLAKSGYARYHVCPMARCIRPLGGGPSPTPFPATPTASATPEPTMMPQPTATVEATDTAQPTVTPEPTDTAAPVPTMTPQPTETPVPKRTDTPRPTATIETTNTPERSVTETSSLTPTPTATVMPAVFPFRVWLPVVLRDDDMPCWCWLVGVI